jgi:hypothetical protein
VPTRVWTLRLAALMGAGTFAVHQLRYELSYGHEVGGHGYLALVGPAVVGALLLALAAALGRIARRAEETVPRLGRLWAGTTASIVVVYGAQESLEGIVTGRVPGMFDHGGLVTLPLAAAVGLLIALIMRATAAATRRPAGMGVPLAFAHPAPLRVVLPPWAPASTRASARHLAARGPPAVA